MRPLTVVFDAPGTDLPPGVEQIPEPTYVEAFIAQSAMEAFHVRVLRGLLKGRGLVGATGFEPATSCAKDIGRPDL